MSPTRILVLLFLLIVFAACKGKKKKDLPPQEEQPPVVIPGNPELECKALPPEPQPFGWADTTTDVNKNINTFFFNPINPNEVIYIVNGDISGYNKMFTYNIPAQVTTFLASVGPYCPKVNKRGWIVFSTVDSDIFKIKTNGDSLTKLTSSNINFDPQWDHTDTNIYYFRNSSGISPSMLIRMTQRGTVLNEFEANFPNYAVFRKKHQVLYFRQTSNQLHLVLRDTAYGEKFLFKVPYDNQTAEVPFSDMSVDLNDEYLYYTHAKGILRCNLKTLKTDTILKNCPNYTYDNPLVSFHSANEITVTRHMVSALPPNFRLHEYHALEIDLLTGRFNEIKIFP